METDNITSSQKRKLSDISSPIEELKHYDLVEESPQKKASSTKPTKDFTPRSYQVKIFEVALKRNTIAVLETGAGKTMIAVMLIRAIGEVIRSNDEKKLIIFLAPAVHLVNQQCEVIRSHTSLEVGEYFGAKGVDDWTLSCWEKEVANNDVLVMTPQILLDALRKAFLKFEMVYLIVIDECHRTTGNHPYAKIMKEFYHKMDNKPKVFGMTASPVVRKGVSSAMDCNNQISELESTLDSLVYTIEDRMEIEVYVNSTKETYKFYDKMQFDSSELKAKIEASYAKFDAALLSLQASNQECFNDMDEKFSSLKKKLCKDHAKILSCLEDLGLLCCYETVKICRKNLQELDCEAYREMSLQCKNFLEEVLHLIEGFLPSGDSCYGDFGFDDLRPVKMGYISPKVHELLHIFLSFGESTQVFCIIFVDKIISAQVLESFVRKVPLLSPFSASYLTGTTSSVSSLGTRSQKETLESFCSGKVNLLFATDVVEEGVDIPTCSCVIRFDLPKTIRSFVQSRGRARKNDSEFVIMLESGNLKQRDQLFDIIRSEWSMIATTIERDPDEWILKACTREEIQAYTVDKTGASITADASVSRLYQYCEKLPADRYYTPRPTFEFEYFDHFCECRIKLPPNAAVQTVIGSKSKSRTMAKQLACLEACKKLHEVGALDDNLIPSIEDPAVTSVSVSKREDSLAGAGTTKRKELHGSIPVRALSGSWGEKLDEVTFHAYNFNFTCDKVTEIYCPFVLLIESKLDDDVGNFNVDLYLLAKMVKASVSYRGLVQLDAEKLQKAKHFHELFFNGLFGRLYTGSKKSGTPREFLLQKDTTSLWRTSNMYLLLPLQRPDVSTDISLDIDWAPINACTSVVEFMRNRAPSDAKHANSEKEVASCGEVDPLVAECTPKNILHFANTSVHVNTTMGVVVFAVHTGRIYVVDQVMISMSAASPFEMTTDTEPSNSTYSTYSEYFNKKYGIVLKNPWQPMLRLKQSHNPHNLLVNFNEEGPFKYSVAGKQRQYVHMPPELLVYMNIPAYVLKSFYLFPSLLHRMESLMLASQLRQEIDCCVPYFKISSSLILEAITTLRCCESFSMERLELLGDSVLKFAVSSYLFLKYPKYHEGKLSERRTQAIRNETLHKLGSDRKLQGYIRDCPFEPLHWVAPGQTSKCPDSRKCKCGLDSLEVPLDAKFCSEDLSIKLGKACEKGHRWMGSKTISDCVEALIGAYYVSGGMMAALHVMNWFGIEAEVNQTLVNEAITIVSRQPHVPKEDELKCLESKVGYNFSVKFLLQQAMTHTSMQDQGVGYCYERLEFLGDSVLDLLITWHLYQSHTDVDPGELTDLRTASVNNESFAQVAVRRGLFGYLQHCSTVLKDQVTKYVESFTLADGTKPAEGSRGPKALGDLVESIAGAILIDTKLNLDEVWRVFKPLLSPIVTPQELQLPPVCELNLLCDSLGYFIKEKRLGEENKVQLKVQLDDVLLTAEGCDASKKNAKAKAATQLLKELGKRGMAYSRDSSKRKHDDFELAFNAASPDLKNDSQNKKQKTTVNQMSEPRVVPPVVGISIQDRPVIESINTKKGGPRITLFELCKKVQWPKPTFKTTEEKSRTPILFEDGNERRTGFSSFVSTITLTIPQYGPIECTGGARAEKKSSFDSAALGMLYKLRDRGLLTIRDFK